jgi:hypothetical protein
MKDSAQNRQLSIALFIRSARLRIHSANCSTPSQPFIQICKPEPSTSLPCLPHSLTASRQPARANMTQTPTPGLLIHVGVTTPARPQ